MSRPRGALVASAADTGAVIAAEVRTADTRLTRLVGLMGRRGMGEQEGLWIRPCRGIHTMWMRFPIDAIFLDETMTVVAVRERVAPWRMTRVFREADSVLELPAGRARASGIAPGARISMSPPTARTLSPEDRA